MVDQPPKWDGWGTPPDPEDAAADGQGTSAAEYTVGYKNPPKHSQWKKGTSGNPKGPKKKGGSVHERVQRQLDQQIKTTGGETLSYSDAILKVAVQGLVGKGARSAKSSIELINFLERFDTKVEFAPTPADETRLNDLLNQIAAKKKGGTDETE